MKEKICEFCGEFFVPNSSQQRYCKRPHYMICPICNKSYLVTNNENLKRPPVACSYACRAAKTKRTSLERYGTVAPGNNPEARAKARQTMQKKFGVDYAMQSEELKSKAKKVLIERYGVDNVQKNLDIRKKCEKTNLERYGSKTYLTSLEGVEYYKNIMIEKYGVEHPIQNENIKKQIRTTQLDRYGAEWFPVSEIGRQRIKESVKQKYGVDYVTQLESTKAKIRQTCLERYGETNPSKNEEIKKRIKQSIISKYGTDNIMSIPEIREKIMKTNIERYGVPFYIMLDKVKKSSGAISQLNIKFMNKLNEYSIEAKGEFRIGSSSYDFILPQHNLLVELNPSYTHNLVGNHWDKNGKPVDYHLDKCKLAHLHGYNIMCIFDWDSEDKLIQELRCSTRRIDINECTSFMLNRKVGIEFLNQYGRNRNKHYPRKMLFFGLVYNQEVELAIAIGINKCSLSDVSYQIVDYGLRYGVKCDNGFWTIMKLVKELIDLDDICLCIDADRIRWNDIEDFQIDINSIQYTRPQPFWSKKHVRIPARARRNHFEMLQEGWLPVCDCGQAIFTYSSSNR